jgi:hypothetical protein
MDDRSIGVLREYRLDLRPKISGEAVRFHRCQDDGHLTIDLFHCAWRGHSLKT